MDGVAASAQQDRAFIWRSCWGYGKDVSQVLSHVSSRITCVGWSGRAGKGQGVSGRDATATFMGQLSLLVVMQPPCGDQLLGGLLMGGEGLGDLDPCLRRMCVYGGWFGSPHM
jgi:hypothetical protein